jgi:glycosyltransferase involved in cell wall biosynthesis
VSDNCSTDDTESVVSRFISVGHKIRYIKNKRNIGPDANFRQCFEAARGKYFLLFSDDDLLVDDSIRKIIELSESDEFGIIYLKCFYFMSDHINEMPRRKTSGPIVFNDLNRFIRKIDVWFTFISGNVVNKSLVSNNIDLNDFADTNLLQLSWTFSSLFNSSKNIYYDEFLVAAQLENTGGYKFCEVFGRKMDTIFKIFINKYGIDSKYFDIITKKSLKKHLSKYILASRKGFGSYIEEDFLHILHPIYKSYVSYWIFVYPAIMWPFPIAKWWCKIARFIAKIFKLI